MPSHAALEEGSRGRLDTDGREGEATSAADTGGNEVRTEEGVPSQGVQAPLEAGKGKETVSSQSL